MTGFIFSQAMLWPVLIPLLAAALCVALWTQARAQRLVSLTALAVLAVASLALLVATVRSGPSRLVFGGWAPPFGISFVADGLSAAMVAVTGILALAVGIFSLADTRQRQEHASFHPLLQGMLAGVNGAFLTGDIFNLYVWFEIMLITAMGLLVVDRTRAQLDGALKYAILNLTGTLLFLLAVAIVYGVTGTLNMADLARILPQIGDNAALAFAAALFLVGFGIKAGYFPLYFWLPASYHTASIVVAAIFAGLLTKVGVYASFRVFSLLFTAGAGLREVIAVMAAGTMLFGVFGAAVQWDIRRILSFHIISQIGYMLLGLALATPLAIAGAIFYIVHHIIVKANLFLIAGAIHRATGTWDLREAGGLMGSHPLLASLFAIPALSLAGLPPLSGFWAKYMVIDASFRADAAWLALIGLTVGILTLFSMSKIWVEAFWRPARRHSTLRPVPLAMLLPITTLCLITVWIGLQPEPLVAYAVSSADTLLDPQAYIAVGLEGEAIKGALP